MNTDQETVNTDGNFFISAILYSLLSLHVYFNSTFYLWYYLLHIFPDTGIYLFHLSISLIFSIILLLLWKWATRQDIKTRNPAAKRLKLFKLTWNNSNWPDATRNSIRIQLEGKLKPYCSDFRKSGIPLGQLKYLTFYISYGGHRNNGRGIFCIVD